MSHVARSQAVHIGASESAESYLSIPKIIAAAQATGADAIHPGSFTPSSSPLALGSRTLGYGFLSENASFAEACEKAGIIFIGA